METSSARIPNSESKPVGFPYCTPQEKIRLCLALKPDGYVPPMPNAGKPLNITTCFAST